MDGSGDGGVQLVPIVLHGRLAYEVVLCFALLLGRIAVASGRFHLIGEWNAPLQVDRPDYQLELIGKMPEPKSPNNRALP